MNNLSKQILSPKIRFKGFNDEWKNILINKIAKIFSGPNNVSILNYDIGYKLYTAETLNNNKFKFINKDQYIIYSKKYSPQINDILYSKTGEKFGKSQIVIFTDFVINCNLCSIRIISKDIYSIFFYYLINTNSFFRKILKYSSLMSTPKFIQIDKIYLLDFYYPNDINEQNKIAKFFELIDRKIELLDKEKELFEKKKKYYLNNMFCSNDELFPKIRFKGFNENWEIKKIKDVCSISSGIQILKNNIVENGKYYYLNGGISSSGFTNVFNRSENIITINEGGASGFVKLNREKFWCGTNLYSLDNLSNDIILLFLYFQLKRKEKFLSNLKQGTTINHIRKNRIENFIINMPSLNEQNKIAQFFELIDNKIELIDKEKELFKEKKKYYLNNMFI